MVKKKKGRGRSEARSATPEETSEVATEPKIEARAEVAVAGPSGADRAKRLAPYAVLVVALLLTVVGWREFWFLTDDAFIAFRYVRNSFEGHGYVWNRAPFTPVDGYTSFAWVALLDVVWRITRVAPPESANVLSLLLSLGTITILWAWLWRVTRPLPSLAQRLVLVGLCLAGTLSNRTFLAWTSSGLETAMYVFAVTACLYCAATPTSRATILWGASAALVALTRPDGLPLWAMTVGLLALGALMRRVRWLSRERAHVGLAVAIVPVVVFALWRYKTYGTLLPNTYYAKVAGAHSGFGRSYLGSFVLEYAIWAWAIWCLAALAWLIKQRKRPSIVSLGCGVALAFHVGYYAVFVGGDHFEFKAFAHLIPILWVTACGAAVVLLGVAKSRRQAALAWSGLGLVLALSLPVPWIHYAGTRSLKTREETFVLKYPVAPHLPGFARFYGAAFDRMQAYLIDHFYCMRHQEHKVFLEYKLQDVPDRGEEVLWDPEDIPVIVHVEAGVIGYRFHNVAMIDAYGLNDRFIARNPRLAWVHRAGHERQPPPGYVEAFEPNITVGGGNLRWTVRQHRIGGDRVREIEKQYEEWLKTQPKKPYRCMTPTTGCP